VTVFITIYPYASAALLSAVSYSSAPSDRSFVLSLSISLFLRERERGGGGEGGGKGYLQSQSTRIQPGSLEKDNERKTHQIGFPFITFLLLQL
jgi:hypothetical protein